jgi:trk/ktr system potassium uptake protein
MPARWLAVPAHPARAGLYGFAVAVVIATGLLMLPAAAADGTGSGLRVALFTATSAVCITGLTVVDTATHWSGLGQAVILVGMQLGGLGIMTFASLLGLLVSRRLGLRTRLLVAAETHQERVGEVTRVVRRVLMVSLLIEGVVTVVLAARFAATADVGPGRALYWGLFHAVSAFNNGGFALQSDSLVAYVTDPVVSLTVALTVIVGSLGFPVLFELSRGGRRPQQWSLHTKITVLTTGLLLVGGTTAIMAFEWTNRATLGASSVPEKLLAGLFHGAMPRSGGFNTLDVSAMREQTWLVQDVLMFIGGGSASTAGGIKVTTFMVLFFAIVAEARGDDAVDAFHRQIPASVLRQAVAIALSGVAVVVTATLAVLTLSDQDLDRVLFEVISAAATVGLSTGITADLPASAQYILIALMFTGRVSTVGLATALALRERRRMFHYPDERPVVG